MTRDPETLDSAFDTQERRCIEASAAVDAAWNPISRFFRRRALEHERSELEQITDEHDIAMLHLHGDRAAPEAAAAVDPAQAEANAEFNRLHDHIDDWTDPCC